MKQMPFRTFRHLGRPDMCRWSARSKMATWKVAGLCLSKRAIGSFVCHVLWRLADSHAGRVVA